GQPSDRLLRARKRRPIPPLSAYRTYTPAGAVVRRGIRMVVGLAVALNRRILRSLVIPGRTLSSGGLVIVFEGEDENERATLVDRIAAWLTWKLDVLVLHGRPRNSRATRRKAFRARSRGMIVLYDGFPEGQRRDTGNAPERAWDALQVSRRDRKSTRLNSSHGSISYAVFCLKQKRIRNRGPTARC